MKSRITLFIIFFIILTFQVFSQSTYYLGTDNLSGSELKSVLHSKIKNHKVFPYTSSSTDTWDILKQSDKDTSNSSDIILIYSGISVNAAQEYNNGNGWNREHVWAKSHGFPNDSDTANTDTHHIRPERERVNSDRGNKDFDNGGSPYSLISDTFTDADSWEPRDEVKGDIARIMFYMATRYQGPSYDLELVDYTGTPNQPIFGKLSTLFEWNRLDPPDDFERNRNDVIQTFQQNRNPFIDRPEFVDLVYNSDKFIVTRAEALSYNQILLTFNKEIDKTTAEVSSNYKIDNSLGTPISAVKGYGGSNNKVVLTLSQNMNDAKIYIVTIFNIKSATQETIVRNSLVSLSTEVFVPVELISFTAIVNGSDINLTWNTATEVNNFGFEIERTNDYVNQNWQKIGFVDGNGTTTSPVNYSYSDEILSAGKYSYRLKQIDFDGAFEFSNIVNIEVNLPVQYLLTQNYPNPFNSSTRIEYSIPSKEYVSLKVYDILGNEITTLVNEQKTAGNYEVKFNAENLPSGLYIYSISAGNFSQVRKMMLLK